MAFGQQSGPPATHKQLQYLESLVHKAGHDGFRDARYPLGLTQRQAAGKFTRDEASTLIDMLLEADPEREAPIGGGASTAPRLADDRREAEQIRTIADLPAALLADELRRRGWTVIEP